MKRIKLIVEAFVGLLLALLVFFYFHHEPVSAEIVSLKYPARVKLAEKDARIILQELKNKAEVDRGNRTLAQPWYLLQVNHKKGVEYYQFSKPTELTALENNSHIKLQTNAAGIVQSYLQEIDKISPFGEILTWDEVNKLFPRMSKAKVRDLETGLSFNIQRRAGSLHADVQPLNAQDTKIFKEIYGGHWSWKRRAVILEKDDYKIAASMNGMPHGQGAIYGNNFPGHFCLHFYKSQTHSKNLDTAHQLMVWKAGGLIEDYLKEKTPQEKVEIALIALNENDPQLVVLSFCLEEGMTNILKYMGKIAALKIHTITPQDEPNKFIGKIEWYELGTGRNYREEVELEVTKDESGFLVRPNNLSILFAKVSKAGNTITSK